jgi:serine/threonine protein kinase
MAEVAKTVGRYEVLREIGRGGMAVVHLARQVDLDRPVALKELAAFHAADPDFARRFVRESRLAGSLAHANVVTVFDYFEHAGTPYIAMEYVERGSLRPYVGQLSTAQIGGVLEGVLAGLGAAEQRAIVHRDLKPENLMVAADGGVKIADFGIAKATQSTQAGSFATATGSTVGTPAYMAPEQAMAGEIGPWTDLYSVGCIAFELFTGRTPFHAADTPMAMLLRHINEPMPRASDVAGVAPEISAWIDRLTDKDPNRRPPSAGVAWEELEEILLARLGPRWRRESKLLDPPVPRVHGPETPPPSVPLPPVEGIDVEGTGPDTGGDMPAQETGFETYVPPPTLRPPLVEPPLVEPPLAEPPPAEPPAAEPAAAEPRPAELAPTAARPAAPPAEPARTAARPAAPPAEPVDEGGGPETPVPQRTPVLARAGALALLAVPLIAVLAPGDNRWNLFAVFSPIEAAGIALAVWAVSGARVPAAFRTGVLIAFGLLASAGAAGLVKFSVERLDGASPVLTVIVLLAAVAILVAGVREIGPAETATAGPDPGTLLLGLAGTTLAGAALFVRYDGFSSLWSEVAEVESAEFFFEPAVAVALTLVALVVVLGTRPSLASGLLMAAGAAVALHFAGVLIAAWRAIGEVGDVRAAGLIGMLGGLLVLAAGAAARREAARRAG